MSSDLRYIINVTLEAVGGGSEGEIMLELQSPHPLCNYLSGMLILKINKEFRFFDKAIIECRKCLLFITKLQYALSFIMIELQGYYFYLNLLCLVCLLVTKPRF